MCSGFLVHAAIRLVSDDGASTASSIRMQMPCDCSAVTGRVHLLGVGLWPLSQRLGLPLRHARWSQEREVHSGLGGGGVVAVAAFSTEQC